MCFEVPALVPPGGLANGKGGPNDNDDGNDDDLGILTLMTMTANLVSLPIGFSIFVRHPLEVCFNDLLSFCR